METLSAPFSLRRATESDTPLLERIIAQSARGLGPPDYTHAQIEAALGSAWGVDTELIRDGTYFVVETSGESVACGGWSRRRTLFGGDGQPGRRSDLLDPARDAARIRAFFVRPGWARQGIGRLLLQTCEDAARAHGFHAAQLVATLPGQKLYLSAGYTGADPVEYPLPGGLSITFIPMHKTL